MSAGLLFALPDVGNSVVDEVNSDVTLSFCRSRR